MPVSCCGSRGVRRLPFVRPVSADKQGSPRGGTKICRAICAWLVCTVPSAICRVLAVSSEQFPKKAGCVEGSKITFSVAQFPCDLACSLIRCFLLPVLKGLTLALQSTVICQTQAEMRFSYLACIAGIALAATLVVRVFAYQLHPLEAKMSFIEHIRSVSCLIESLGAKHKQHDVVFVVFNFLFFTSLAWELL